MVEIKQLSEEVADQISAGEVIERPASVVKELVENSIDAGSDKILIEVKDGGKEKIRVKDNGNGIRNENLKLAFSRYATSKIDDINDIYSLNTLGFRGEALASIAAVSRVEALSKHTDDIKGSKILIKGSKVLKQETTGCPQGTDITITELFYNTPARYKYMKTTNTEFGHISDQVNDEALAYPKIQFTLKHNNKQVLNTPGTGKLKDCIYALYGKEMVENLIPLKFEDNYIQVEGFITNPNFNRSSRVYEKFFVNGRVVRNLTLNYGVEEAYKGLLPAKKYPVVFLNLKLNPILVDVNVHPTKKEVKFSRNQVIKKVLKNGIAKKLKKSDTSTKIKLNSRQKRNKQISKKESQKDKNNNKKFKSRENLKKTELDEKQYDKTPVKKQKLNKTESDKSGKDWAPKSREQIKKNSGEKYDDIVLKNITTNKELSLNKILGHLHKTYILIETSKGLYIVDQHAAHERIIYEKLFNKYNQQEVTSQPLLVPLKLELSLPEVEIVKKYDTQLNELGIKMENFGGNTFIIQEVPAIIKNRSNKEVIKEIIDNLLDQGKSLNSAELIEEIIIYMSCRSAVKAGEALDKREMKNLIKNLFQTESPGQCPHKRPTMIHLDISELESEIGRK